MGGFLSSDPAERNLVRRYLPPAEANRASQQYRHYRRQFPETVPLLQVGRFFEFYERSDEALARALELEPMRRNTRGARYGFPAAALRVYLPRLLALGRPVMVIGEEDEYLTTVKTRTPLCRYDAVTSG